MSLHPQWLSAQRSIAEPAVFAKSIGAEDAVLCFSDQVFSRLVDAFDLGGERDAPRLAGSLEGRLDDAVAVYKAYCGAPSAGICIESLIVSGVERVVMVGTAGSISPRCEIGDVLLPTWGVREEGTSYHYLPPDVVCRPSEDLLCALQEDLETVDCVEGGVWSLDALFRETVDKIEAFAERGVLAVEMECTALMAIATYRGAAFAAALIITDELFGGEWVWDFRGTRVTEAQELVCGRLAEGFRRRGRFL